MGRMTKTQRRIGVTSPEKIKGKARYCGGGFWDDSIPRPLGGVGLTPLLQSKLGILP